MWREAYKCVAGGAAKATDDFSLDVKPGEMFVLLGGSGCGRSTALRSLAGLEDIQAGRIFVGGRDVTGVPVNRRNMAMVFQAYSLFPHMTALQNIEFGLEAHGVSRSRRRTLAMEKLDLVGLADQAGKYTQRMSGGQQQRVAIARALAVSPRCCCATSRCPPPTPRSRSSCATRFAGFRGSRGPPPRS